MHTPQNTAEEAPPSIALYAPDVELLRELWRSQMSLGAHIEQFTTWTAAGVAAITVLMLSNLQSLSTLVCAEGLRNSLLAFIASLALAVVSKQLGAALSGYLSITAKAEAFFRSPQGQEIISGPAQDLHGLRERLVEAHWWPMSWLMRRSFDGGRADPLYAEKLFLKILWLQMATNLLHLVVAAAALLTVTLSARL